MNLCVLLYQNYTIINIPYNLLKTQQNLLQKINLIQNMLTHKNTKLQLKRIIIWITIRYSLCGKEFGSLQKLNFQYSSDCKYNNFLSACYFVSYSQINMYWMSRCPITKFHEDWPRIEGGMNKSVHMSVLTARGTTTVI